VRGEVLGQVVLAKESLLANATLVGLDSGVPLLVPTHVGAIGKFHLRKEEQMANQIFASLTLLCALERQTAEETEINTHNEDKGPPADESF
jgi:hypothetical protein